MEIRNLARGGKGSISYCLVCIILLALSAGTINADQGDSKNETSNNQPLIINCVGPDETPVRCAEVYLFQHDGKTLKYESFGPFMSDEKGQAVCPESRFINASGDFDRWVYARVPGELVGATRCVKWANSAEFNTERRVKLVPSTSIDGQVTVPDGFDCTKVKILVRNLHFFRGEGNFDFDSFPRETHFPGLNTALPGIFECYPDATGHIRFSDLPVVGQLYLVTVADGLGEAQWSNWMTKSFDEPIELSLDVEHPLSGRVLTPDGKPASGMKINARLSPSGHRNGAKQIAYNSTFSAITNAKGEFAIRGLPEIEFIFSIDDPKKVWAFRPLRSDLILVDDAEGVIVELENPVQVSGRLIDTNGKPVKGIHLSAISAERNGSGLDGSTTDANGRYEFQLPSGEAYFYINGGLPDEFVYPDPPILEQVDIVPNQKPVEVADVILKRKSEKE